MTEAVSIVFPHQIFKENPCIDKHRRVFIVEDDLFFSYQPFHKMKLVLHRASMKFYADFLANKGYRVTYVDHADYVNLGHFFSRCFSGEQIKEVHYCDPVDFLLSKRLSIHAPKNRLELFPYQTPMFLNNNDLNEEMLGKSKASYRMGDYYKKQRLHHDMLVDNGLPIGGKWSLDEENRKALPKNYVAPTPVFPKKNNYVQRAIEYVEENFSDNPGETTAFFYPITFKDAEQFLANFLTYRFNDFGPFQDALSNEQPFLNHSLLSSSLNNGLLTPDYVIHAALKYANENQVRLSSIEGFVRQIIGWREFIRAIYERHGVKERTENFWKYQRKLDDKIFEDIAPLKAVHEKSLKYAYSHHIERLMLLGNFFLLAEIHPDEVYNYFMTYYIDAYDWVMVPNVYGMSQFADGGIMSTKPYVSSSNYLNKMGLKRERNWAKIWDALYWRFVFKNEDYLKSNHRTAPMTFHLKRMKKETLEGHLNTAEAFLK